jgi:hypothetical protein
VNVISVGDEVEVCKDGTSGSWTCVVQRIYVGNGATPLFLIRPPGAEQLWFSAEDGKARGGWSLAPKHVPARAV